MSVYSDRGKTEMRWAVTHIQRDGLRALSLSTQGRDTYEHQAEAEAAALNIVAVNGTAHLSALYGPQSIGTFRADRIECWAGHFDPCAIYIHDETDK